MNIVKKLSTLVAVVIFSTGALSAGAADAGAKRSPAGCRALAPNEKDFAGDTNFARALTKKDTALIQRMLDCNADVSLKTDEGWFPIHGAAYYGPASVVDLLVSRGADVNKKGDYLGWTPLHMAVSAGGNIEVIKALLKHGADRAAKDDRGETPYQMATAAGYKQAAALLTLK